MNLYQTKSGSTCKRRRGVATVEFAVTLPIIMLIALGSIEGASMIFLRQAMVQSAYEGAKVAAKPQSTNQLAIDAITAVTAGRNLDNVAIAFDPADVSSVRPGDPITVGVSAPGDSNSFIPFGPFRNRQVSASSSWIKE